jgi:hypothetical protein
MTMPTERVAGESKDTAVPAAQDDPLQESLGDASVLLWFASREGKDVEDKVLTTIVSAQSKLRHGSDPEVEGRFWTSYRKLAKAVQPASIDSILATYSYPFGYHHSKTGKRRLTDAARTKKVYSWMSLCILSLLLVVQIFWFIGTTWRTDLETHRTELDRIAGNLRIMMLEVKGSKGNTNEQQPISTDQMLMNEQSQNKTDAIPFDFSVPKSLLPFLAEKSLTRRDITVLLYANATLRGDRVEQMLMGNYKMLKFWDFVTNIAEFFGNSPSVQRGLGKDKHSLCVEENISEFYRVLCEKADDLEKQQLGVEDVLVNARTTLAVLNQYLLPLLYGLIGSLAYILRTLSREIHNVTFTRGSEIRYALRWPLGMLGGVTVGLFFDPADFQGFAAITPLGLAFLAGYGVELLFTGLDRMVSAFTGEGSDRPKQA